MEASCRRPDVRTLSHPPLQYRELLDFMARTVLELRVLKWRLLLNSATKSMKLLHALTAKLPHKYAIDAAQL